ncbi:MAG: protoporphyrinogen oxidase [Halobacteria archaeon]|nr:protoporphyrinogen oxidase [Halobacteria archaeon]
MSSDDPADVVVVGAGVSGLCLTHFLRSKGIDVVTFESEPEPGGVIDSETVDARLVENGPQRMRYTDDVEKLVESLGIDDEVIEARMEVPMYVYFNSELRLVPFSASEFLRTDVLSLGGKLRLLVEPLTDGAKPDETAGDMFTRKFGGEAYENVIEPLFGGLYGSDPDEMYVRHSLSRLRRMEEKEGSLLKPMLRRGLSGDARTPAVSFEDGMQTFTDAIYDENSDAVELGRGVVGIDEKEEEGYVVETEDGEVETERIVVTTPAYVAADLLEDIDAETSESLRSLNYNSVGLIHLRSPECDVEGFGYQIRKDEEYTTLGVTFNDSIFDADNRDGIYTAFVGGVWNPEAVTADNSELEEITTQEFEEITGCDAELINVSRWVDGMPSYDTSWEALDGLETPEGIRLCSNYISGVGVPTRLREARQTADEIAREVSHDG